MCEKPKPSTRTKLPEFSVFCSQMGIPFLQVPCEQESCCAKSFIQSGFCECLDVFGEVSLHPTRGIIIPTSEAPAPVHVLKALEEPMVDKDGEARQFMWYQNYCFYCQHNPSKPPAAQKTSYHCVACVGSNGELYPLWNPDTGRDCFQLHIVHGLPQKWRYVK